MVKVLEMFRSIQGEGSFLGMEAVFIRFAGCNLECDFCDTQEIMKGHYMQIEEQKLVIDCMSKYYDYLWRQDIRPIVVLTGGEPTLQFESCRMLSKFFKEENEYIQIHLETNGTRNFEVSQEEWRNIFDWTVCSPKRDSNWKKEEYADEMKYVVDKEFDVNKAISVQTLKKYGPLGRLWLQPNSETMHQSWQMCADLARLDARYRVGIQLHKIVGVQ